MMSKKRMFFVFLLTSILASAQGIENLAEKVVQEKNRNKKELLLKALKQKLAKANKEAKELATAVIREKRTLPLHLFKEQNK